MSEPPYQVLQQHYERCLAEHGDSHLGVNWSRKEDADRRHALMRELLAPIAGQARISLLDFGCGLAHFNDDLLAHGRTDVDYAGLDISPAFITHARARHPAATFYCLDVLLDDTPLPRFDYIVLNGVFTAKRTLSHADMWAFMKALLTRLVPHARVGLAFNVMSKHVDWEREDLFHLPFDELASYFQASGWRTYKLRSEDGLYDYFAYLYPPSGA